MAVFWRRMSCGVILHFLFLVTGFIWAFINSLQPDSLPVKHTEILHTANPLSPSSSPLTALCADDVYASLTNLKTWVNPPFQCLKTARENSRTGIVPLSNKTSHDTTLTYSKETVELRAGLLQGSQLPQGCIIHQEVLRFDEILISFVCCCD